MEKNNKIQYWLDIADYDMETARTMFKTGRYLYVVFMCQQAIEKTLKAMYIDQLDSEPPRSHNLTYIIKPMDIDFTEDITNFFNVLSAHYIRNRYPDYKTKLSSTLNNHSAKEYLDKTEEIFKWLKYQIKSLKQ